MRRPRVAPTPPYRGTDREDLGAIRHVDDVVETPWLISGRILDRHAIHLLVHGDDNRNAVSPERLVVLPRTEGISIGELRRT